ncbi:unnamed protein product [Adineta ricciae]|uniref:Uncharacterized protein n=1 Tax=Adineta ricciae TaxID=249248 RepID=A0A814ECX8_ADIRI|nr:unnamed protein product [Adineta ricciae]CAF0967138.1 unnamed protein product [Adineta ricciae]
MSCSSTGGYLMGGSVPFIQRPHSPPILTIPNTGHIPNYSLNNSLPPQVIYKPNNQEINYKQNVYVRWLKPPTPPPLGPVIIREIQPPPVIPPPIIYRHIPPPQPTPPPIIVREPPPPCPPPCPPLVIEKRLPAPCLPPQVIVEQCPPPPQPRQVIIKQETCQPAPCRRLVREIIRQVPQQCAPAQPAVVCTQQKQHQIIQNPPQITQELTPVYATRRHIIQPRGIRVIRQVVGPAQSSYVGIQQQQCVQNPSAIGASILQGLPAGLLQ